MAKYQRRELVRSLSLWTHWWHGDGKGSLSGPLGKAELFHYPDNGIARVHFQHGACLHTISWEPCPTRRGLVRMACREIRKIVGEKHGT